jgi:large subunit ribosomal protein L3
MWRLNSKMINGMIGRKIGMTQIFDKVGNVISVTVVQAGPCKILELKESPKKVKIGFEKEKASRLNKPMTGYFKKLGIEPLRNIKELSSVDNSAYTVGQDITVDLFKPGDYVDVSGRSIGKGFQGGMKRHNWSGGPGGHGSMHHRRVGSIGASADPSRVLKGTNMPGHMGHANCTVQGLRVMDVDLEQNLLLLKGGVPGCDNTLITIKRSFKKQFKSLDEEKVVVVKKINPMKQSKAAAGSKKGGKKK